MAPLSPRLPPQPGMRLRRSVIVAGVVTSLAILVGIGYVQGTWTTTPATPSGEDTTPTVAPLPETLSKRARDYAELETQRQQERPPVAQYLGREKPAPAPVPAVVHQGQLLDALNPLAPFTQGVPPQVAPTPAAPPAAQPGQPTPTGPGTVPAQAPTPKRKRDWEFLARGKDREKDGQIAEVSKEVKDAVAQQGQAQQLIKPALWAIPSSPLQTLYRSMQLPARTLDTIVSDISGMVRLQLTVPILDRFGYGHTILPKNTIIVAMQEGSPAYGMSRIPLKLEQAELETGEVISLKATIGDAEGAQGLAGRTNSHITKLVFATGLSALLNIGARSIAGQPQGFNYSIGQEAARETGQGVQRDAQSIIDRELRIKTTITVPKGTLATIDLTENIQLNRKPVIAR